MKKLEADGKQLFVATVEMPLILSLETATRAGSVAIMRGDVLLASSRGDREVSHSTHLLECIRSVLEEAGVTLREIDVFAVATGPGSFTGLRIGLATVKSFSATLVRPCIGIQTLHAVAHAAGESRCTVAMLTAGRGEVYAQRLAVSSDGAVEPLDAPTHQKPQRLLTSVTTSRNLKWAGEGALNQAEEIKAHALSVGLAFQMIDSQAVISSDQGQWTLVSNSAALSVSVAMMALAQARTDGLFLPQDLRAIYVRPSDAELNQPCPE